MVQKSEKGRQARKYFIECEKKYIALLMERQSSDWLLIRQNGKLIRRNETDAIQKLIPYAESQGSKNARMFYVNYSALVNKQVGLKSKQRDIATWEQLQAIRMLEDMITRTIQELMAMDVYYKDIYKICKSKAEQFAQLTYLAAV